MRIVVAMSGGVDSSVTAARLLAEGHQVIGLTMTLYDATKSVTKGRGGTCCSPAEVDAARRVCDQLGIPHYVVDERERFESLVIDDFVRSYAAGRTPNPCVRCNEHVKFAPLLARADALGAELLATGHYARIVDGGLHRARDLAKDQSYFLFAMGRAALSRVMFPLGETLKSEVRGLARGLQLPNADTPDSQEICFVPDGDHGGVVERRARMLGVGVEALAAGPIVDESGVELGTHRGIHRVTIGQRRGLGVAGERARYVLRVIPATRTVIVGEGEHLARRELVIEDLRWLTEPCDTLVEVAVQVRHRSTPVPADLVIEGSQAQVTFHADVSGIAPGQAAVVYRGDHVLVGGWIV